MDLSNKKTIFGRNVPQPIYLAIQFLGIFFITFLFLYTLGLVPEEFITTSDDISGEEVVAGNVSNPLDSSNNVGNRDFVHSTDSSLSREDRISQENSQSPQGSFSGVLISSINIANIGVSSKIGSPSSQDIATLDDALKKGAVHYPGSGTLEDGNIFLFGHSTNWKIVNNQAYKTFNDLDKLSYGEEISLTGSDGRVYIYSVEEVNLVDENTAFVDFTKPGKRLTISTCNTFGQKQERWVVDAVFKEVRSS